MKGVLFTIIYMFFSLPAFCVPPETELVIAIRLNPPHFNPAVLTGGLMGSLGSQLFAGLTRLAPDGHPIPYLAAKWTHSPDYRFFSFTLREATFHDGTPVTSDDVAFSILAGRANHPFRPMLEPVERVETPDRHTVIVRLSRPFPQLPSVLVPAFVPIIPRHVYGDGSPLISHPANMSPVGSGPFMLESYKPDQYIRLIRNPHFFLPGRPVLERVTYRIYWDQAEILPALFNRDIDLYLTSSSLLSNEVEKRDPLLPIRIRTVKNLYAYIVLQYNLKIVPFNEHVVRKALDLALDRETFCGMFTPPLAPQYGPLPSGAPFHIPTGTVMDKDKAERLLDEAGYPRGKDGKRFSITVECAPGAHQFSSPVFSMLSYDFSQLGIEMTLRNYASFAEWGNRMSSGAFQASLDELFVWHDPLIGIHRLYGNSKYDALWSNTSRYENQEVERLLLAASSEVDWGKRQEYYTAFQRTVTEEHPMLWIASIPMGLFHQAYVLNLEDAALGIISPLDGVCKRFQVIEKECQ